MATDSTVLHCSNDQCRVSETGKCIEGLPLDSCPHLHRSEAASDAAASLLSNKTTSLPEPLQLPSGARLSAEDASAVLRAGEARVLAIIAPADAGKTSLIASLFGLFQNGPVGEFHFAGSRTLYAFEQACHHARAASGRAKPDTLRTPIGPVKFYHLGVGTAPPSPVLDLLLADRSGEAYRSAADDPSVAGEFVEVHRADSITVLLDGERLLDVGARHNLRSEIEMMLQGLIDGDAIGKCQRIALVLTKLDLIQTSPDLDRQRTENDFCMMVSSVRNVVGHMVSGIVPFRVAASPATDVLPRGHGVADLLKFWTAPSTSIARPASNSAKSSRAMARLTTIIE
ncbi:MAG: hypothetical protein ABSG32_28490 [Terriglobia bacterium]